MKILAIRGKNLASLEDEFEIDFTKGPLFSAGIFAITGSTGAGKSTILDAMCLALFDNAPRFNKAERIKPENLEEDMLSPQDTKNILRRGATEAFAEVDFVALNGNIYSSRWMVRRARGKSDGTIQPTVIRLNNLTERTEEQGTKTDLLKKICELIGLTFDQFTRAVLLAQGDFATFLKARQNEKAELLEKLTGTEIYSKISTIIYRKTKEAEQALDLLQQRIKDIKLLTDEEVEGLFLQKSKLEKDLEPIRNTFIRIEKKLVWIKDENQYKIEAGQALSNLQTIQLKIEEAKPRYEYIEKQDAAQEIRDSYNNFSDKQKQLKTLQESLLRKETELQNFLNQKGNIEKELIPAQQLAEDNEKKFLSLKPEISKARELDIKIIPAKENRENARKEYSTQLRQKELIQQNIADHKKKLDAIYDMTVKLGEWFVEHDIYKEIIPRTDLIINLLNDAGIASTQRHKVSESLESGFKLMHAYEEQLELLEVKAKELNDLLPAEIVNLREKLVEGEPCPVCGSTHHLLKEITQEAQINEQELEKEKKNISVKITDIKEKIEYTRKGITQAEALINNYLEQYENAISKASEYLRDIPAWQEQTDMGVLIKGLLALADQWKNNKEKLDIAYRDIESLTIKLEAENQALANNESELSRKKELLESLSSILNKIVEDRTLLLGGRKADDVETYYIELQEKYNKNLDNLKKLREKTDSEIAKAQGFIIQIKDNVINLTAETKILQETIKNWINTNKYQVNWDILKELLSKSYEWIVKEKEYLSNLKKEELSLFTSLNEKKHRLKIHAESENKPLEGESMEILRNQLYETQNREKQISRQKTEIEISLAKHKEAEERIRTFEKELDEKKDLCENWQKLNILLGSADGAKFKTIAQGYTLDILLGYANKHLFELTKRYKLEKIPDTLALQVVDNDMLGEVRTVHSLSGGESFLISLSLALGLSSLSSNRMKIESLFIDEGFGSLDIDTLGVAMDALENLQTQGRKIGVISHVAEMTERIMTQVQVIKLSNGRSSIKVI